MTLPAAIKLVLDPTDRIAAGPVPQWAVGKLRAALALRGTRLGEDGDFELRLAGGEFAATACAQAHLSWPAAPEALALWKGEAAIVACGHDERGLAYAVTELADRITCGATNLHIRDPVVEHPANTVRGMMRLFTSIDEDRVWFTDREWWIDYLDMLAMNRYNRFSLTLGLGYNYLYHNNNITDVYFHFPYPFLLELPGFDIEVAGLSADERNANLDILKFVGREATRRGLDFRLSLWTQRYDFDDTPRANYTILGVTPENHAAYCRAAIAALLTEIPEICGITVRTHAESGILEGDYDFWKAYFAGIAEAYRPIEIDLHPKGIDSKIIDMARATGNRIVISPKYVGEHMALPYHPAAIRAYEYPPAGPVDGAESRSRGARSFLRYGYGDMLPANRDWDIFYRIWPGSQRVLLWGDPVFSAAFARNASFCGGIGLEWFDPQSYKGRQGQGVLGQRLNYKRFGLATKRDFQKYEYQYRLQARLAFSPDAADDIWLRYLKAKCGDAADECAHALASASRVLPLVTLAHAPAASNNHYWPEIYTNMSGAPLSDPRPFFRDMEGEPRFGNAPSFDSQLFANANEFVTQLLEGTPCRKYSPLDVAAWLEDLADTTERALLACKRRSTYETPSVQRIVIDATIMAGMARFFAEKFRSACWIELYLATHARAAHNRSIAHARRAVLAWRTAADASRDNYYDDLSYGPQAWARGAWHDRLPRIENEVVELEAMRAEAAFPMLDATDQAQAAIKALQGWQTTRAADLVASAPQTFTPGDPLAILAEAPEGEWSVQLHYRHVNQGERWKNLPMQRQGQILHAEIPGDYTRSEFHLQFYVSASQRERLILSPGLTDLAATPYHLVMQASVR